MSSHPERPSALNTCFSGTVERRGIDQPCALPRYVLITPAHNEEAFIQRTLESVIRQTVLPLKWVIVDDGSTDSTPEIIRGYSAQYPWIEVIHQPKRCNRNFAAKVTAFNLGYDKVNTLDFELVANLDADLSFEPDYLEFILRKFSEDDHLGVAGTVFQEEGYSSDYHSFEGKNHVPGGCQVFRKHCFEQIGGFRPAAAGGVDWVAVTTARMKGWKTRAFREKSFFHHRRLGTAGRGPIATAFSYGKKDYYLGGHPIWEFGRVAYQTARPPYLFGGFALAAGYMWAGITRAHRSVSRELMMFHRREQMMKVKAILKAVLMFKRVDRFTILAE